MLRLLLLDFPFGLLRAPTGVAADWGVDVSGMHARAGQR